jgi:putative aldouronate transport system substrate-binding protein
MTYWVDMGNATATVLTSFAESEMYKKMEEISGVKIEFIHPPAGQSREQFNLMIASRDLPDLIEYGWGTNYPGGADKAISDGMIIKLNNLIDKYAPNYKSLIESNPVIKKQVLTDNLYSFPAIGMDSLKVNSGPLVRKDLLDKLSLSVPETIDEWDTALSRMKNELNIQAPLTGTASHFTNASTFSGVFGVGTKFYLDNGIVKYGQIEQGYREYVTNMKEWYQKGLLDPDFLANDTKAVENMVITGKSALVYGAIGGGLGLYMNPATKKDPGFNMVAAQFPVKNKGDIPRFAIRQWEVRSTGMLAITTANKHPETAAKWADYFYSKEETAQKLCIEGLDLLRWGAIIRNIPNVF